MTARPFAPTGTKDLPRVARLAGRATGRAVNYISALRSRAFSYAEENDLNKVISQGHDKPAHIAGPFSQIRTSYSDSVLLLQLHEEIQASMRQLNALRDEMRSGVHIFGQG